MGIDDDPIRLDKEKDHRVTDCLSSIRISDTSLVMIKAPYNQSILLPRGRWFVTIFYPVEFWIT